MTTLLELKRPSIFGQIITKFSKISGGFVQIDRKLEFHDGPYRGKELYKRILLTAEEFEELRSLEID